MNKLQKNDGTYTVDQTEILDMQASFYENLYKNKQTVCISEIRQYLSEVDTPKLTEEEKQECEGLLSVRECEQILKTFKNGKTPGNDGITAEFYKKFWPLFGRLLVESLNASYVHGELTPSQKQAIISLLDKGKDRTLLKNWRPISLLNVDSKIASKALACRL